MGRPTPRQALDVVDVTLLLCCHVLMCISCFTVLHMTILTLREVPQVWMSYFEALKYVWYSESRGTSPRWRLCIHSKMNVFSECRVDGVGIRLCKWPIRTKQISHAANIVHGRSRLHLGAPAHPWQRFPPYLHWRRILHWADVTPLQVGPNTVESTHQPMSNIRTSTLEWPIYMNICINSAKILVLGSDMTMISIRLVSSMIDCNSFSPSILCETRRCAKIARQDIRLRIVYRLRKKRQCTYLDERFE